MRFPVESDTMWAVIMGSPLKYPHNDDRSIDARINLVNLGNAQILTIPGEALPNIGFYLKRKMRGEHNLLFGLTNDAFGYILTKVDFHSFPRYDYVSRTSLGEMTGEILIEKSLEFVNRSPAPQQLIHADLGSHRCPKPSRTGKSESTRRAGCLWHNQLGGVRRCRHLFLGWTPTWNTPAFGPTCTITSFRETQGLLSQQLRPKYVVRVEERTYISDDSDPTLKLQLRVPDVEVAIRSGREEARFSGGGEVSQLEVAEPVIATTWLEEEIHEALVKIIDRESRDVVTVIEILSPANKVPGSPGHTNFEQKRREIMKSPSHWVEIDLLRGNRLVPVPRRARPS